MAVFKPLTGKKLMRLRQQHERRRKSVWAGSKGFQQRKLLPAIHGDGGKVVLLSFFAAPEVCIVVLVDSSVPLELPESERYAPSPRLSFRDLLDTIYDQCEDTWYDPPAGPYRWKRLKQALRDEYGDDLDDAPSMWSLVLRDGGTWCNA